MSADFNAMSDRELKRYFLKHRDNESFHAYMDRRYAHSDRETISPDDPEWEAKLAASIERQICKEEIDKLLNQSQEGARNE